MFGISKFVAYTAEKAVAEAFAAKQIEEEDDRPYNPFHLTKQELAELDPNYKKPKKKVCKYPLGAISPPNRNCFYMQRSRFDSFLPYSEIERRIQ